MRSPYHTLRFARRYDAIVRGQYPFHRQAAQRLVEFAAVEPGQTVLDLGAGTGIVAREVLRLIHHGTLLLTDPSTAMLAVAAEHLTPDAAGTNLRLIRLRADRLSQLIPSESVDAAVASYVTGWLYRPQRAFREVAHVLRPGGVFVFDVPPPIDPQPHFLSETGPFAVFHRHFSTVLRERLGYAPAPRRTARRLLDYPAWVGMAQAAGFTVESVLRVDVPYSMEDAKAIWRDGWWFSAAANPALWLLPHEKVQAVVDEAAALAQASAEYQRWQASGDPLWETYAALKVRKRR